MNLPFGGKFLPAIGNAVSDLGYGISQGGFKRGFGIAAQRGAQMQPYRDAESLRRKTETEKAAQESVTMAFLRNKAPQYLAEVEAGVMTPSEAYWKAVTPVAPKVPDLMTVAPGASVIDKANPGGGPIYTAAPDPKDAFGFQSGLSKEYTSNPTVQAYEGVKTGYEKVQTAAQQGSGAGDMSLIFGFMKMLDPASTVREGEYASAQDTGGIPAQIVNLYNKALTGVFLTPEQRADFLRTADGIYQQTVGNLEPINQQFSTRAGQVGVDPSTFLRTPEVYAKPGGGLTGKTSTGISFEFTP